MAQKTMKELETLLSADIVAKIQGAERVVVDLDTGESAAFPEREPAQYEPALGATTFFYDPAIKDNLRRDSDLAEFYVRRWESQSEEADLDAADYNNIACAYLWLARPDWKAAYQLFKKASEKAASSQDMAKKTVIDQNKAKAERALDDQPELPVRINLKTYDALKKMREEANKPIETVSAHEIRRLLDQWE